MNTTFRFSHVSSLFITCVLLVIMFGYTQILFAQDTQSSHVEDESVSDMSDEEQGVIEQNETDREMFSLDGVQYEDPREVDDPTRIASEEEISIMEIEVVETAIDERGVERSTTILFKGKASPQEYVTLYIFSTPIIVSVRADSNGEWQYLLKEKIADGSHVVYVAKVDETGSIRVRSNPLPFTKQAAAIEINSAETRTNTGSSFLRENIWLVAFIILTLGLVTMLMASGVKRKEDSEVDFNSEENNNNNG